MTPSDATFQHQTILLHRKLSLGGLIFLDSWPFVPEPVMVIADPDLAAQVTQKHPLPKHPLARTFVEPVVGRESMILAEGTEWKALRSMFNPGFASPNLATLISGIVDTSLIFCDVLTKHAEHSDVFRMEDALTRLTVDIIGRVVLDVNLNSQTSENELVTAFRSQVLWTPMAGISFNPFVNFNPLRPIMQRYYTRKMDNYISKVLDARFSSSNTKSDTKSRDKNSRVTVDLAFDQYIAQRHLQGKARTLEPAFKRSVVDQMKSFIFAGHDTTSSLICYVYYLLSLHPEKVAIIRKEHDDIFGKNLARTADVIKEEPNLLNKIPYTLAVIKGIP